MLAANVACGLSLGEYTALTFAGAIRQARCLIINLHGTPKLHPGAKVRARHAFCLSKHSPTFACHVSVMHKPSTKKASVNRETLA